MRVLLDSCVWGGARATLVEAGHDVDWVGAWPSDPGDSALIQHAHGENRVLVTLDKDFGELAIVREFPHAGILRLVDLSSSQQGPACLDALGRYGELLQAGAIITVESHRVRVRTASRSTPDSTGR